jgi:hypothetical protein
MDRQSVGILLLVSIIIGIVFFAVRVNRPNKLKLAKNEVSKITICKAAAVGDKVLTFDSIQIKSFLQKWSQSKSIGSNKLSCNYFLDVTLTNGKKHVFGISQDHLTENWGGGDIYSINDENYFDSLFTLLIAKSIDSK